MTDRIRPADAVTIRQAMDDGMNSGDLSISELRKYNEFLEDYDKEQASRLDQFQKDGLTAEDARTLLDKENASLDDGTYDHGGTFKKRGPHSLTPATHGVSRAINAGAEGVWRAVEGTGDLVNEVGVTLNLVEPETRDQYRQTISSMRMQRQLDNIDTFGRVDNPFLTLVGEATPWMATATIGSGSTLMRYAANQAMIGGLATATVMSDLSLRERMPGVGIGAGLGFGLAGAFGMPSATQAAAARGMVKKMNSETAMNNREVEAYIMDMLDSGEFGFSLAQITGDRTVAGLEARAAGATQKKRQNKNMQLLVENLLEDARKLGDAGRSADEIGLALRDKLSTANRAIHKNASEAFGDGLEAITEQYGDQLVMSHAGGVEYLGTLDNLLTSMADDLKPGSSVSKTFKTYRDAVSDLVNPALPKARTVKGPDGKDMIVYDVLNRRTGEVMQLGRSKADAWKAAIALNKEAGGLSATEIRRIQEGLNDIIRGKTAIFDSPDPNTNKHVAKALFGSFMDNLETNARNPDAVQALKDLSKNYKAEMLRTQKLEELVVTRVFGQAFMPGDADKALDIVLQGGESSLRGTREFLEEWAPDMLGEVQGLVVRRIVDKAGDAAMPAVDGTLPISLDKFANALAGRGPNGQVVGQVGRGLLPDAVQSDLRRTGEALRVMKNVYFTGIVPGGSTIDDLAINVVSRSPEFMARFLTRVFTTGKGMDDLLTDPLTRKAIQTIAEKGPTSRAGNAAMNVLARYIGHRDAIEERERMEDRSAEADRRSDMY